MTIELTDRAKELAASEVNSGRFSSVEEFVEAAVQQYAAPPPAAIDAHRKESWQTFDKPYDLASIASDQGVGPLGNAADLKFEDWPDDDPVEAFIARARGDEPGSIQP